MSSTPTYTPTLMQKLLGRNYKWWYLTAFAFKTTSTYKISNLFEWLQYLVIIGGSLSVWWVNYQSGSKIAEFSYIFTYFVVGEIFDLIFGNSFGRNISDDIKDGKITGKLLNTSNVWLQYFFRSFGAKLFWNLDIFLWIFIAFLGSQFLVYPSFSNTVLAIILFLCGSIMQTFVSVIIGSMAFIIIDTNGLERFVSELDKVGSGKIIPLNLFWVTNLLTFTHLSYLFYHPMQIYLGKYSPSETLYVFLGGIGWCVVLYFLAKWIFKAGLKRNESVGL